MASKTIKLTVINDLVCPYCYIGHRELLDALSKISELRLPVSFEIEYRPFVLISNACKCENAALDKRSFYLKKLGQEKWDAMEKAIGMWSEEKGIKLSFSGPVCETTLAHRLSRKAFKLGGQRMQLPFICALFKAYAEQERDIGDINLLAGLAEGIGMMSKEEAVRFLESDELLQEVEYLADEAKKNGVSGVPLTVIDGKWAVSGGQRADVYIQIFKKLATCNGTGACPKNIPGAATCPSVANSACQSISVAPKISDATPSSNPGYVKTAA